MFDRYQVRSGPSRVSVDVTEHRAPTDESVRLLKEMEAAAAKKFEQSIRLEANGFKFVLTKLPSYIDTEYGMAYEINGKRVTLRHVVKREDEMNGRDAVMQSAINRLAESIAIELLSGALREAGKFQTLF